MNKHEKHETLDAIFGGRIKILQSRTGYRFSLDSLLLADFTRLKGSETVVDLGTGNGVVPLILAERFPTCHFLGLELQDGMIERARKKSRRSPSVSWRAMRFSSPALMRPLVA